VAGGLARGFRDVDAGADVGQFATYLDAVSALVAEQKRATIELLALCQGDAALDVGCGAGDEVRLLAEVVGPQGRAVGLDLSEALLTEARARCPQPANVEFVVSDAHRMPFADAEFDGARVERALQHMAHPVAVLAEMSRVVRVGGRVVAMEPDWHAMVISGEDLDTARIVVEEIAGQVRNPAAGRSLPAWFRAANLKLEQLDAITIPIRSFRVAKQLLVIGEAIARLDTAAVQRWLDDLYRQDAEHTFLAAMTLFIAAGVVVDEADRGGAGHDP
jgi:ubiquinone/menaquinone biosynthesis C-methylase UbiE